MELRIGQLLADSGVLTQAQVEAVLQHQRKTGEPFGLLCERLFGTDPQFIEDAWAKQYSSLTRTIDPADESFEQRALELITRRQAWQFRVLPIHFDHGELMMATTQQHLRRALRFATNVIAVPVFLVLASSEALGKALCRHYPLPGMTPRSIDDDFMDRLLTESSRFAGVGYRAPRRRTAG